MKAVEIIFDTPVSISGAIKELRLRLGLTQLEMANRLGGRVRECYIQWWESGKVIPGGKFIIKMLQMCPDDEALAAFGIRNLESGISPPGRPLPDPYDELFKNLRAIIDSGQSQLIGHAEEVLAHLADQAHYMTRKRKPRK
jgi:transcriptional regulator with XRE-family HTH domain